MAKATDGVSALQAALAAEHAAVYGYGVVGALVSGPDQAVARDDWLAHQLARDHLESMLTALGATPVAAEPAYRLPFPVTGNASAVKLAAALEDGVTRAYLGVVAVDNLALRAFGAKGMQTAANRALAWTGQTAAFPGMAVLLAGGRPPCTPRAWGMPPPIAPLREDGAEGAPPSACRLGLGPCGCCRRRRSAPPPHAGWVTPSVRG